jgi:hypothetical protein
MPSACDETPTTLRCIRRSGDRGPHHERPDRLGAGRRARHGASLAVAAAVVMLAACRLPRAPGTHASPPVLESGASTSFEVTLTPDTWYAINFLQFVARDAGAETVVEFSTRDAIDVVPIAYAHPRAEVAQSPGPEGHAGVHVDCPGLGRHPLRVAVGNRAHEGSLSSRTDELGHYGFAFRSESSRAIALRVTLRAVSARIALMFVGVVPGDAIRLDPVGPGDANPLRPARGTPHRMDMPAPPRYVRRDMAPDGFHRTRS